MDLNNHWKNVDNIFIKTILVPFKLTYEVPKTLSYWHSEILSDLSLESMILQIYDLFKNLKEHNMLCYNSSLSFQYR